MITAHRHQVIANQHKVDELLALFPAFQGAFGGWCALVHRELLGGMPLQRYGRSIKTVAAPFSNGLSTRQLNTTYSMVNDAVLSWQALMQDRVRKLIKGSMLPEERQTVLYRVNANKAWWAKELELDWVQGTNGELSEPTVKVKAKAKAKAKECPGQVVQRLVSDEDLFLARALAKQAQKSVGFPDLRRANTLRLDSGVAMPTRAKTANAGGKVGWWVNIATLHKGNPVKIPLVANAYFERQLEGGELCGALQLHRLRDEHGRPAGVEVSLLIKRTDAPARTKGMDLGLDFGISSALFAASDGQLLGHRMLARLRELDATLTARAAELQRSGVALKKDRRYRKLQASIRGFVTNEVGRLLNKIAARDGDAAVRALVVEDLDFRGGGLSPSMNRLITRAGRSAIKARLAALTAKHGIEVVKVPSPYTSQQCSYCWYTDKANRRDRRHFECRRCGLKLHADVNAARVVCSRRSLRLQDHTGPRSRENILQTLNAIHQQRWALLSAERSQGRCRRPGPTSRLSSL